MTKEEYEKSLKTDYNKEEKSGHHKSGSYGLAIFFCAVIAFVWWLPKHEVELIHFFQEHGIRLDKMRRLFGEQSSSDEFDDDDMDDFETDTVYVITDNNKYLVKLVFDSLEKASIPEMDESSEAISKEDGAPVSVHVQIVEQAQNAGPNKEGTTQEILERIIINGIQKKLDEPRDIEHERAVERAERRGISTEGTTQEILARIEHDKAVKWAESKGVSTEGTMQEIIDRIIHADAVAWAKKKGVSTEGTTEEILERIRISDNKK